MPAQSAGPPLAPETSHQIVYCEYVPEGRRRLEPGINYLVSHPRLDPVGVYIHAGLLILQCRQCRAYLATDDLKGHMKAHKISIEKARIEDAMLLCRELKIYEAQKHVLFPTPLGPPIQNLDSTPGYICRQPNCGYAVVCADSMTSHERTKHNISGCGKEMRTRKRVSLQVLFPQHKKYTAVEMDVPTSWKADVTKYISETFLPMVTAPPAILTASDDRGRTRLELKMKWDSLLLDIRGNREALQQLVDLKAMPGNDDQGIFSRLASAVKAWCKRVEDQLQRHPASNDLERVILYGDKPWPSSRYAYPSTSNLPTSLTLLHSAERWKPVSDTNKAYYSEYAQLLRCVIRQLRGHPFPLLLPLTTQQRVAFEGLRKALENKHSRECDLVEEIQSASWELVSAASDESWKIFYRVYFAFTALGLDGTYAPASALSPHLAKYLYMIRVPCLMKALQKPTMESVG